MLALILAPVYVFVNLLLARWVLRWTGVCHRAFGTKSFRIGFAAVYAFLALTPLTGFLVKRPAALHRLLKQLGSNWLGWLLYLGLAVVLSELALFALRRVRRQDFVQMQRARRVQGGAALAVVCAVCLYGLIHAETLFVTDYTVTIDKPGEDMTIVLLADLHLGYATDPAYIEQAAATVNEQQPDLIVLAGDIFDNEYEAVPEPARVCAALASLRSTYGVYACWGNHDVAEPILAGFTWDSGGDKDDPRFAAFLAQAGIRLLDDETTVLPNGVQLIGRRDPSRGKKLGQARLTPDALTAELDKAAPIFVIDHQPKELAALAAAGVDLDLSGHTHDGQLFPGNLTIRLLWENACGHMEVDGMHAVVTSGLGVWGPAMRVGTKSEIVRIQIRFAG